MESIINTDFKTMMNTVIDELQWITRCQFCNNVLDGSWWNKDHVGIAKPSYMELEYCSFVCEREYYRYNPRIY